MSENTDGLRRIADAIDAEQTSTDLEHAAAVADLRARIRELQQQPAPAPAGGNVLSMDEVRNFSHGPRLRADGLKDAHGVPLGRHDAPIRAKKRPWSSGATSNTKTFPVKRVFQGVEVVYRFVNNWWECWPIPGGMSEAARNCRLFFTVGTLNMWNPKGPFEWVDKTPKKAARFNGDLFTGMAEKYDNAPDASLSFRQEGPNTWSIPLVDTTVAGTGEPYDNRNPAHWYNPGHYTPKVEVPDNWVVCATGYAWLGHDDPKADISDARFEACLSVDLFPDAKGSALPGEEWKHYGTGHPCNVRMGVRPQLIGTFQGWSVDELDKVPPVPRPAMPSAA